MSLIVVGGHSRSVGKTSVVAGLIAALPEFHWTAMKITQYGHGICSATASSAIAQPTIIPGRSPKNATAPVRATARAFWWRAQPRSLWVRTRQGMLAEAMPRVRKELAAADHAILESNSVMRFLRPDLYLTVLDAATADFKASAQQFLDRADAVILHDDTMRSPGKTSR